EDAIREDNSSLSFATLQSLYVGLNDSDSLAGLDTLSQSRQLQAPYLQERIERWQAAGNWELARVAIEEVPQGAVEFETRSWPIYAIQEDRLRSLFQMGH